MHHYAGRGWAGMVDHETSTRVRSRPCDALRCSYPLPPLWAPRARERCHWSARRSDVPVAAPLVLTIGTGAQAAFNTPGELLLTPDEKFASRLPARGLAHCTPRVVWNAAFPTRLRATGPARATTLSHFRGSERPIVGWISDLAALCTAAVVADSGNNNIRLVDLNQTTGVVVTVAPRPPSLRQVLLRLAALNTRPCQVSSLSAVLLTRRGGLFPLRLQLGRRTEILGTPTARSRSVHGSTSPTEWLGCQITQDSSSQKQETTRSAKSCGQIGRCAASRAPAVIGCEMFSGAPALLRSNVPAHCSAVDYHHRDPGQRIHRWCYGHGPVQIPDGHRRHCNPQTREATDEPSESSWHACRLAVQEPGRGSYRADMQVLLAVGWSDSVCCGYWEQRDSESCDRHWGGAQSDLCVECADHFPADGLAR